MTTLGVLLLFPPPNVGIIAVFAAVPDGTNYVQFWLYIKLAYDGRSSDQSWLVRVLNSMFCLTSFLVFRYHHMCMSVEHNWQTHMDFNNYNIFLLATILFYGCMSFWYNIVFLIRINLYFYMVWFVYILWLVQSTVVDAMVTELGYSE